MDWYIAKNNELINISDIPCLDIETLRQEIIKLILFFRLNFNKTPKKL